MAFNPAEKRDTKGKWTKDAAEKAIKALTLGAHVIGPNGAHVSAVAVPKKGTKGPTVRKFRVDHANKTKLYLTAAEAAAHASQRAKAAPEPKMDMLRYINKAVEDYHKNKNDPVGNAIARSDARLQAMRADRKIAAAEETARGRAKAASQGAPSGHVPANSSHLRRLKRGHIVTAKGFGNKELSVMRRSGSDVSVKPRAAGGSERSVNIEDIKTVKVR